jgi:nucleoside-diphosphate-sugar epimerase
MTKIGIFGATGVLGSYVQALNSDLHFKKFIGDIRDRELVATFISESADCDAILHLAALVPKQIVENEPKLAVEVNVEGTLNILEGLKRLGDGAPWLFYASTSHVYASSESPIAEDSKLDPYTYYGLTKLQGEEWCNTFRKQYGLKVGIGRIFSYSDSKQSDAYFLPAMFNKVYNASQGEILRIPGVNGKRDFLRVSQIDRAISKLMEKKFDGVVNIGTGHGTHLLNVIKEISELMGRSDLVFQEVDDLPTSHVANIDLLRNLGLVLKPETDLLLKDLATKYIA